MFMKKKTLMVNKKSEEMKLNTHHDHNYENTLKR